VIRPRLRHDIEPIETQIEGRPVIALRDPEAYAAETAIVEPPLLAVLAYFDGSHSLDEIRDDLERRGADGITVEFLNRFTASLDRCHLLETESFERLRAARERDFAAQPVREAAHAGAAYPEDDARAAEFLDGMLAEADEVAPAPLGRLVSPHIDYRLGAAVYGHAGRRLAAGGRPDVVVVLGVCHQPARARFIACRKDFATPRGTLRFDASVLDAIETETGRDLTAEQLVHRGEHSIEFQALWLAHLWPDDPPALVPILVNSFHDHVLARTSPSTDDEIESFVRGLRRAVADDDRRVVVLASIDLSHMGPRYGHPDPLDEAAERELEAQDRALLAHVASGDAEAFFAHGSADGNARHVDGLGAVYVLLRLREGEGELLRYGQGRIDPETGSVVSFAALAFGE